MLISPRKLHKAAIYTTALLEQTLSGANHDNARVSKQVMANHETENLVKSAFALARPSTAQNNSNTFISHFQQALSQGLP